MVALIMVNVNKEDAGETKIDAGLAVVSTQPNYSSIVWISVYTVSEA